MTNRTTNRRGEYLLAQFSHRARRGVEGCEGEGVRGREGELTEYKDM
jgi:hypothetical protein